MRNALIVTVVMLLCFAGSGWAGDHEAGEKTATMSEGWILSDVGFERPESVFWDEVADMYYVSNLVGQPLGKDGNGFISKVSTDGELLELKWIASGDDVPLNAPKGMGRYGDKLLVTDIDVLRVFDINTGEHMMEIPLPGATFANDIAVSKGVIFVSDTGSENDVGGIYSITLGDDAESTNVEVLVEDADLHGPNGLYDDHMTLYMVPYGGNEVFKINTSDGSYEVVATAPTGALDGLEMLKDGRLAFTSWEGKTVYVMDSEGKIAPLFEGLNSPADIGYDRNRNMLLIPQLLEHVVLAKPLK